MNPRINLFMFFVFLSVLIGIAILSLLPPKHVEIGEHDKIGHFIAYATLMVSFGLWKYSPKLILIGFVLFAFYGAFIEWLQGFIPGRFPSVNDIFANIGGLGLGYLILLLINRLFGIDRIQ